VDRFQPQLRASQDELRFAGADKQHRAAGRPGGKSALTRTAQNDFGRSRSLLWPSPVAGKASEEGGSSTASCLASPARGEDCNQTLNDSPQPHASLTLGLLNLKPSFKPSRAKSSSVPARYGRLFGSMITLTPWLSNR